MMKTYLFRPEIFDQSSLESSEDLQKSVWIEVKINPKDLLNLNQVGAKTKLSKSTILRRIKDGSFPRSNFSDIHRKKNYWLKLSVFDWVDLQKLDGELPEAYLNAVRSDETDDAAQAVEERGEYISKAQADKIFEMRQKARHDFEAFCKDHPRLKDWAESRKDQFTKGEA